MRSMVDFSSESPRIRNSARSSEVAVGYARFDPNKRPTPHVHNLLFSDTHYGEVVDSIQVAGVNEYDVDVCKRRIGGVHKALQSFVAHRDYTFEELVISCLGDMVSGGPGIHDEIRESNELTAAEQGYEFGIVLGKFVEELVPL